MVINTNELCQEQNVSCRNYQLFSHNLCGLFDRPVKQRNRGRPIERDCRARTPRNYNKA
jgi:hypothetical protein